MWAALCAFLALSWASGALCAPVTSCRQYVCHPEDMEAAVDLYFHTQVTGQWAPFFDLLADDVKLENSLTGRDGNTKAEAEAILGSIGLVFQKILRIVRLEHFVERRGVLTKLVKTQQNLLTGEAFNNSYVHEMRFNTECKISFMRENVNLAVTENTFPEAVGDAAGLTCLRIARTCSGEHYPDFGQGKRCYDLWRGAPQYVTTSGAIIRRETRSLACANNILNSIESSLVGDLRPLLCPHLGKSIEGIDGCW